MAGSDEDDLPVAQLVSKRRRPSISSHGVPASAQAAPMAQPVSKRRCSSASSREAPAGPRVAKPGVDTQLRSTEQPRRSKGLTVKILVDALEFLAPKVLLWVLVCSKQLRHLLTYTVAVRSILLSGSEHGKTTLRCLMALICGSAASPENRWAPPDDSGGRIWIPSPCRLIRLAVGQRCEMPGCPTHGQKVNHIRPDWGVFACWHCTINYGTMEVKSARQKRAYNVALRHPRTCSSHGKYLWRRNANEGAEKVGPVVTLEVLDRLQSEGRTLNDFLAIDASGAAADSVAAQELLAAFLPANTESRRVAEEGFGRKQEKQVASAAAKQTKFDGIVQGLRQSVKGEPWTDLAMNSIVVKQMLQPFKKAPSKFTRKAAKQLENDVRRIFANVNTAVIELSFLGDSIFQQALKSCALQVGAALFSSAPKTFYELINQAQCREAVLSRVAVADVFAQAVVSKLGALEPPDTALAADFFGSKAPRKDCDFDSGTDALTSYFIECESTFGDMLQKYEVVRRTAQKYCSLESLGDRDSEELPALAIRQTIFTGTSGGRGRGIYVPPTRPCRYLSLLEDGSESAFRSLASQQKKVNVEEVTACFDEDSMILVPAGCLRVGDLRVGDAVVTHCAAVGRVACITRGARACQAMCQLNGIWLTPKHPIRIDGVWVRPENVAVPTQRACGLVNLMLESGHVVSLIGRHGIALEVVTLAHQGRDGAAGVPTDFWGSADCLEFPKRQTDFPDVLLPKVDPGAGAAMTSPLQMQSSL